MPLTSHQSLEIKAPPDRVWQVITDLSRYAEWNRFVPRAESSLRPGDSIVMQVQIFDGFAQRQKETIFENVALEKLCYGVRLPAGALRSRRCHHLSASGTDSTEYRSEFELAGWLSPVVAALMGRRLQRGFEEMAEDLQRQAEQLTRETHATNASDTSGDST
jgi:uncharacterized protein YndB with AHSA1/START domain